MRVFNSIILTFILIVASVSVSFAIGPSKSLDPKWEKKQSEKAVRQMKAIEKAIPKAAIKQGAKILGKGAAKVAGPVVDFLAPTTAHAPTKGAPKK
jgi:hypothetical protein